MILFYSTENFRTKLQLLLNAKRHIYAGVTKEICDAFRDVSKETILNNRDLILLDDPLIVIKLRLPDHKHRLSKKDGFRLIYMTYKNQDRVIFLDIYPKRGPFQQLTITDSELLDLIDFYNQEAQSNKLVLHDINNNLELITCTSR